MSQGGAGASFATGLRDAILAACIKGRLSADCPSFEAQQVKENASFLTLTMSDSIKLQYGCPVLGRLCRSTSSRSVPLLSPTFYRLRAAILRLPSMRILPDGLLLPKTSRT